MRNHTLNLFKMLNLHELDFSYKLVEFELPLIDGKQDLFNKNLLKVVQKISSLTAGPAAVIKRGGKQFIAIPADKTLTKQKINVSPFSVTVNLQPTVYNVNSSNITEDTIDVVSRFLDFDIRKQLTGNAQLWKLNTSQFFLKKPVFSSEQSNIEVFGGFTYKLVRQENGEYFVSLDLTYKYIDKHFLSHYVNASNVTTVGLRFRGDRCLYHNGDDWYTVEIVGFGKNIKDHEFTMDGKAHKVYQYIADKTKNHTFKPSKIMKDADLTLLYKYPGRSMEPHHGASSVAKFLYDTNDPEVKALHRMSIKEPARRFESINKNISWFFQNLSFNGKPLNVSSSPVEEKINFFPMPGLKFNNGKILKIGRNSNGGTTSMQEYGMDRKKFITENGVLNSSPFDEQFLIVPEYLDKNLVEAIKRNAEWQLKKLAPTFNAFKVIRYKVIENAAATFQVQEIEKVLTQQNTLSGFALFILPDLSRDSKRHTKSIHDCLKKKFYPRLKFQCASASKIKPFFESYPVAGQSDNKLIEYRVPEKLQPRFRSYIFNLVMGYLIVNRKWPFALAENPNYDIYIGIDVHDRYAGFSFFFKNGESILFFPEEVPKKNKSTRAEKLKAGLISKMIYEKLKTHIPRSCSNPNGIVIIRDGKSFGEEGKALQEVITKLQTEGILPQGNIPWGVVDLHKQSAIPLRIASQTNGFNKLENPSAGSYRLLNSKEGFIFSTGYPFQIPGTCKPIQLILQEGSVSFLKVMQDVFGQTMLAFSAPDRSNSLPITIKLIDNLLEPLTATAEIMEEEEEEEYEEVNND